MADRVGAAVLVTGSTGFLGQELVRTLRADGARVTTLARSAEPSLDHFRGDIRDRELVEQVVGGSRCSVIYHLAGEAQPAAGMRDPAGTHDVNVGGTLAVLEAARRADHEVRVVAISSDSVGRPDRFDEHHPYVVSKRASEQLLLSYTTSFGVAGTALRLSNVYGPNDPNRSRLVPAALAALAAGDAFVPDQPDERRNLLFLRDAVLGLLTAETAPSGVYRLCGPGSVRVGDVVEVLRDIRAGRSPIEPASIPEPSDCVVLPGWRARVTLVDGLKEAVASSKPTEGLR